MTFLARYSKAIAPFVAVLLIVGNALGPQNELGYILVAVAGLLGTVLGPANAPAVVPPSIGTTGPPAA